MSTAPLLEDSYINAFPDFPEHMNALGKFVYLRTYSRYLYDRNRREVWKETAKRSSEYNVELAIKHLKKLNLPIDPREFRKETELLFRNQFNLRQFLSGRTLWVGGADNGVADKYPLANFNCSFLNIEKWEDLSELFYLLLVGTGVGFKCTKSMAANLPKIKINFEIEHIPYAYAGSNKHLEESVIIDHEDYVTIYVGDSKEGWVGAAGLFFKVLTEEKYKNINKLRFSYNHVRPKGTRLKTFGGTASGPEPLQEMFEGFKRVLQNQIDTTLEPIEVDQDGYGNVRPVHILDMGNLVGNNVVVGGVRRTAEIFLFDADDFESLWAKYGVNGFWKEEDFLKHEKLKAYLDKNGIKYPAWFKKLGERNYDEKVNIDFVTKEPRREADGSLSPYNFGTGFYHRAMSNNSIGFVKKPKRKFLNFVFTLMKTEGEPGFINLYEAAKRRLALFGITDPKIIEEVAVFIGLNPCAEILLWSKGVCNLTTVNVTAFIKEEVKRISKDITEVVKVLDVPALIEAQKLSARAGLRMTLVDLELDSWSEVQKRDRLLGTSLTGWKDALAQVGATKEEEDQLLELLGKTAREEANNYAAKMRVPAPLLVTTVKPEGTLSQVAGGVSSGLHWSHSPYYIRRVRINSEDPLAKAVLQHKGWNVNPENGTPGNSYEEKMANARTYVIDFPIYSGSKETKDDISVERQFETYFSFQDNYTEHNSSNTITIRDDREWDKAEEIIFDNWDNFVGVSFLALDGGTYQLPPYEAITKERYEELSAVMIDFDFSILEVHETAEESDLEGMEGCEGGICPIR